MTLQERIIQRLQERAELADFTASIHSSTMKIAIEEARADAYRHAIADVKSVFAGLEKNDAAK